MMRILRRTTVFFAALLLTVVAGKAQTPLGQPSFDEQKVQVWCATAKFVYEDNGRPNLKSTLRCGGSLKEFENSIRADSQRVFSALYQPLEGRGTIYRGLGSNPSRLQKLKTEIINRLKSSPARRANPARMQRLATLETALTNYVGNGTPIGEQPEPEEESAETLDTATKTDEAAAVETGDAGLEEAGIERPAEATRGAGESWINKVFGPLALIMSLLSLALYVLMRRNMAVFQKELIGRMTQRQDEIMATRPTPVAAAAPALPQQLTPELQRQVEQLVLQRVEAELAQREQPITPAALPTPVPPRVAAPPVTLVAPAPPPLPVPELAASTPASVTTLDAPVPMTEVPGPPVVIPAGSPATALREDFESVVPPVQLPDSSAPTPPETIVRYGKASLIGMFQEEDFTAELQDDSVYEVFLDPQWPELASFQVSPEPAVQTYLLQSAPPDLLAAACEYEQPTGPVTQITTVEEGILRKVEGVWQVEQKALVQFEG